MSVKALAVSCIGAAAALHPEAFFNSLYLEPLDGTPVVGRDTNKLEIQSSFRYVTPEQVMGLHLYKDIADIFISI